MSLRSAFAVTPFGETAGDGGPLVSGPLPELTADEKKNGWTPEKLARYRQERDRAAFGRVFAPKKKGPERTARGFDPHAW